MSAAQWLIASVGLLLAVTTFMLMRFPHHRREQYRGRPFSIGISLLAAALMLTLCLMFVWAQGQFEAGAWR